MLRKSSWEYFAFKALTIWTYKTLARIKKIRFQDLAKNNNIHFESCSRGLTPETLERIKALRPDVIFNASALILTSEILAIPSMGVLSFHGARLPEFRGAANYFWVLFERQKQTQATVHIVDQGLDTGAVVRYAEPVRIDDDMSVFDVYVAVLKTGEAVLNSALDDIRVSGKIEASPQDSTRAKMRSLPTRSDVDRLKKMGRSFFGLKDIGRMVSDLVKVTL